jgi:hypothetical protein
MANRLPPVVLTTGTHNPHGTRPQPMTAEHARKQVERRKGAQAIHRTGQAHKWDSETARKAARRRWRRRQGVNDRKGTRTWRGKFIVRLARRPAVTAAMRETIRAEYSQIPKDGLFWGHGDDSGTGQWWVITILGCAITQRRISERAALVRLGHLRNYHGYVPEKIVGRTHGTTVAQPRKP